MFSCEYCNQDEDDQFLLTLPCGYLTCYEHFIQQPDPFTCFMCQEHLVEKNVCFSMKKNREKINAINNAYELKILRSKLNEIKQVKDDPKNFVNEVISGLVNKIDLRREEIKLEINNKIDEYFDKLYIESQRLSDDYENNLIAYLNGFDLKQIKDSLEDASVNLEEVKTNQIKPLSSRLEEIKNVELVSSNFKFQFDGEKMFGKISNKLNSGTKLLEQKTTNDSSRNSVTSETDQQSTDHKLEKKYIPFTQIPTNNLDSCEFAFKTALEMSNGELLSVSKQNPKNLVIWNYETGSKRELTGNNSNICLFKLGPENLTVSLSNDYWVKVWQNETSLKIFQIPQTPIYSFQVDSTKMIIYDTLFKITTRELLTGRVIRSFQAHSSPVTCLKLIKPNRLLSCHEDKSIKLWDISIGKCVKQFESESKVICLDIIDRSEFITGEENGRVCIRNIHADILKQSKTSTKPVRFVKFISKAKFLSYSEEGLIRLWKISGHVFSVDDRAKIEGVKFLTVLSNGNMLTCSEQGVATVRN